MYLLNTCTICQSILTLYTCTSIFFSLFSLNLFSFLLVWRKDELERINNTTAGPERKAALCLLLEQEATLIASIGRHKVVADVENQDKQVKQFLEAVNITHTHLTHT